MSLPDIEVLTDGNENFGATQAVDYENQRDLERAHRMLPSSLPTQSKFLGRLSLKYCWERMLLCWTRTNSFLVRFPFPRPGKRTWKKSKSVFRRSLHTELAYYLDALFLIASLAVSSRDVTWSYTGAWPCTTARGPWEILVLHLVHAVHKHHGQTFVLQNNFVADTPD